MKHNKQNGKAKNNKGCGGKGCGTKNEENHSYEHGGNND